MDIERERMSMNEAGPSDSLLARLRSIDTPSVCNAIEVAQGMRGFAAYTRDTPLSSDPESPAVVGLAATAVIAGYEPPADAPDVLKARRLEYFRYMAAAPSPAVAVIEDADHPRCAGAWWGEVHTAVHQSLGLSGALTNGAIRDLGDLAAGFPVIAGSVSPSHAFVHVREMGTPVTVFGLTVSPGDLVHADRHGAVVVPDSVWSTLESAIDRMYATEQLILGPARQSGFDIDALEAAWSAFERARI